MCKSLCFFKFSVFQEGLHTVTNLKLLVVDYTQLILLLWFNFYLFMLGFSEEIDSHGSLPFSFLMCAIVSLIICFDLGFRNMFREIIISLLYYIIFIFKTLLQIFLLFNFLPVLRNLISVKVLMISGYQKIVSVFSNFLFYCFEISGVLQ